MGVASSIWSNISVADHQGTAAARGALKGTRYVKAGIGYHEVVAGHTTVGELRRGREKLLPAANSYSAPVIPHYREGALRS